MTKYVVKYTVDGKTEYAWWNSVLQVFTTRKEALRKASDFDEKYNARVVRLVPKKRPVAPSWQPLTREAIRNVPANQVICVAQGTDHVLTCHVSGLHNNYASFFDSDYSFYLVPEPSPATGQAKVKR